MSGWSTKGICLCIIMLMWVATGITSIPFLSITCVSASPNVPYSLGDWEYVSKPVLPIKIEESEIPVGSDKTFVYPLEEGKTYRVYCYGDWIDYATETNKTDYDIFVYDPSGDLESYHTEAAGLPEHLGTTVDHPFFIPKQTGDYSFRIKNDARESNGAQAATFMLIEHIETDQWYQLDMEGKINDEPVERTTWAYEFITTNSSQVDVIVEVPDTLDMYETRLYIMANPTADVGAVLNGLPLPLEEGLYGTFSGTYGGYNLDSEGVRINDAMASCEYPGEDMLLNFTIPVEGNLLYHLAFIAEYGNGPIRFLVKTDFESPELTIVDEVKKAEPNQEAIITARVGEQSNLDTVTLNYTKDNGETYTVTEMAAGQKETYNATIPGQPVGTLVNYTVVARDVSGNNAEFAGSYWVKNSGNVTLDVSSPVVVYGESMTVTGSVLGGNTNVTLTYELVGIAVNGTILTDTAMDQLTLNNTLNSSTISRVVPTDSSGIFIDEYSLNKAGKWAVWATWNGSETYFGATSEQQEFIVQKMYIAVTCNLTSPSVTIGDNVTIIGHVEPVVENLTVNVMLSSANLTITQAAQTNVNGTYVVNCKPETMGSWHVFANIPENDSISISFSNTTTFMVTDTFLNQYLLYIMVEAGVLVESVL